MKRAIVLLSGGIDSATTLAIAGGGGFDLYALSFDYGQGHGIELESAKRIATAFNVRDHLVMKFNLRDIGGSALTSDLEVPKDRLPSSGSSGSGSNSDIPVTYVPARNTIFLSFALAWAESIEASDIFIGANAIDYSGYPDCRPEFIECFQKLANLATRTAVNGTAVFRIHAPLISLSKAEIIRKAIELKVDLAGTWSCYSPERGTEPCLRCDSCILRARGFREAGIDDPLLKVLH